MEADAATCTHIQLKLSKTPSQTSPLLLVCATAFRTDTYIAVASELQLCTMTGLDTGSVTREHHFKWDKGIAVVRIGANGALEGDQDALSQLSSLRGPTALACVAGPFHSASQCRDKGKDLVNEDVLGVELRGKPFEKSPVRVADLDGDNSKDDCRRFHVVRL